MKGQAGALILVIVSAKLFLAGQLGALADEAYHWTWSHDLAWGYYDQPPMIAWANMVIRSTVGDRVFALRLLPIALQTLGLLALLPFARDRLCWVACAGTALPLSALGLLAVPDAYLLGFWALALAAALRGGRAWLWAGLFAGAAALSKHVGFALAPLLLWSASACERRTRWPWIALWLSSVVAAPNLFWNAQNGWVTVLFQWREGLWHPAPPGVGGVARFCLEQAMLLGPFALVALARRRPGQQAILRADRMAWNTAVPLLAFFGMASAFGPSEAHWPAPAFWGVALCLARTPAPWAHARRGASVWAIAGLLLAGTQAVWGWAPFGQTLSDRFKEGARLAQIAEHWPSTLASERYQEAALLHFETGRTTHVWPGCGRATQYDATPPPQADCFVRPSTRHPPTCFQPRGRSPNLLQSGGGWELWCVESSR